MFPPFLKSNFLNTEKSLINLVDLAKAGSKHDLDTIDAKKMAEKTALAFWLFI